MIKNILVSDLLEKCYTKKMKEQDEIEDELKDEEKEKTEECRTYKECKCQENFQIAFFGINYVNGLN